MALARPPQPVKLIAGLLAASEELLGKAHTALTQVHGTIDDTSVPALWKVSSYYDDEIGTEIWRQFISFAALIDPGTLAAIKSGTNQLEDTWRKEGRRKLNIDPGYVGMTKLVLATTKDAAHRIYLGDGIYAEATLRFESGGFQPYTHTYPDYADEVGLEFFSGVRARYVEQLRESPRNRSDG
jgi:hypothetical protein